MNNPDVGIIDLIIQGGAVVVLVIGVWLLITERLVPRGRYIEEKREKEAWRALALHGAKLSRDAIDTLKGSR